MKRRNEVVVGAAVILGIALIIFGTIWLQGMRWGVEERVIRARVAEAGQILKGNPVKLRGVLIGRVENVELEPAGSGVIVTMSIDENVRLPEDPVVILSPESMFGDWMVQIFPRSAFPQYRYAESPRPEILPGYSLPDMSRLTAVADEIAQNIAQLTSRFEIAFTEETAVNVREAIENIQRVSEQLNGLIARQSRNADELAAGLQTTSQSISEAAETARRTFAQLDQAVGEGRLKGIVENVERATAQTDSIALLLADAATQIRSTAITADSALAMVRDVAGALERGEGTLGKLLQDTTLYYRLTETTTEVQLLLQDLRANPRKYINLRIF